MRRLFVFPISEQNKNVGFSLVESGNRDTSIFVQKNRDILGRSAVVSDHTAIFSPMKKKLTCRAQVFFHESKKKKNPEVAHPCNNQVSVFRLFIIDIFPCIIQLTEALRSPLIVDWAGKNGQLISLSSSVYNTVQSPTRRKPM